MTAASVVALRAVAEGILRSASRYSWTLQGFGMLRLHLPGDFRLHVWDSRFRNENVSDIHDHQQWGLRSTVVAGALVNRLYFEVAESWLGARQYHVVTLKPGVGTHFKDDVRSVWLRTSEHATRAYMPGESYQQAPGEIHSSHPEDGTVTVMQKFPTGDESARVFWPHGTDWVTAEPVRARPRVVEAIVGHALARWFDGQPQAQMCPHPGCGQTDGAPCSFAACPQRRTQG